MEHQFAAGGVADQQIHGPHHILDLRRPLALEGAPSWRGLTNPSARNTSRARVTVNWLAPHRDMNADIINAPLSGNAQVQRGDPDAAGNVTENVLFKQANTDSNNQRLGYVRFDTSGLPTGAVISSVTLDVPVFKTSSSPTQNFTTNFELYGVNDGAANGAITEANFTGSMTYNQRPDGTSGSLPPSPPNTETTGLLGSKNLIAGQEKTYSFNDPDLISFVNSDTNGSVAFILTTDQTAYAQTGSLGNTVGNATPSLTINYAVPEPASLALLGVGGLAAFGRRRRSAATIGG